MIKLSVKDLSLISESAKDIYKTIEVPREISAEQYRILCIVLASASILKLDIKYVPASKYTGSVEE